MNDDVRAGLSTDEIKRDLLDNLFYLQAKFPEVATRNDWYLATAYTVRDRLLRRWVQSAHTYYRERARTVCYFSAEFLLGPQLGMNLLRLNCRDAFERALNDLQVDLNDLIKHEKEPALGTGGLGRLAACFMESMATLQVPSIGYGIRYEYGIFKQLIRDGWQVEVADQWLRLGYPWEISRPDVRFDVKFGGHTEAFVDQTGRYCVKWIPEYVVQGTPFDTAVLGFGVETANLIRLWKAEAHVSFDFHAFNAGDYYGAVHDKVQSENITKVLYPNDEQIQGRELRLKQQYFFVSCSLQDMIRLCLQRAERPDKLNEKFAVQLNDTHPSLSIPELMRLLIDEHQFGWDEAWRITQETFSYTNHTLLAEALERWPVSLLSRLLPRHYEIILEINKRFLNDVRSRWPHDPDRIGRLSLIDERGDRSIRMAHLACVGSHAINGVAELHTNLLKRDVLRDIFEVMPQKFSNKTNGVSHRRFLLLADPRLSELISDAIGPDWIGNLDHLRELESLAGDAAFRNWWRTAKHANKAELSNYVSEVTKIAVDPQTMFDVQVKRIHEYKRQHLNLLHVITLYNRIKQNPEIHMIPRTVIFGGKAAPGYFMAKLIIKLINAVAEAIDADPAVSRLLKVVFVPDFDVGTAQHIYPAADLSEQISTAGMEASGTGNMKMALNGAMTIGTLDGANIEIRDDVGVENFFLFGLTADEIRDLNNRGYEPRQYYDKSDHLRAALNRLSDGTFSPGDVNLFRPIVDSLLNSDPFKVLADYESYVASQDQAAAAYSDVERWTTMSILNVARLGRFSSDRAVRDYCRDIWKITPGAPAEAAERAPSKQTTQYRSAP